MRSLNISFRVVGITTYHPTHTSMTLPTILPLSGPREIVSGDVQRTRVAFNMDLFHPDGNIYGLDTVIYANGETETVLPGSETYNNPWN